jgi:hypothetical protein
MALKDQVLSAFIYGQVSQKPVLPYVIHTGLEIRADFLYAGIIVIH